MEPGRTDEAHESIFDVAEARTECDREEETAVKAEGRITGFSQMNARRCGIGTAVIASMPPRDAVRQTIRV